MKKVAVASLIVFAVFASNVFSANFGVGIFAPFSLGVSRYDNEEFKIETINKDLKDMDFEWGVLIQPGYFWGFDNIASFAFLLDLGYYKDNFTLNYDNNGINIKESYTFNSFNVGIYPKFSLSFISLGIGGGVKLPISGSRSFLSSQDASSSFSGKLSYNDIKDIFETAYIPYLKVSLDFLIKFSGNFALVLGIYANYDFPIIYKKNNLQNMYIDKKSISALDVGLQVGMYIVGS